MKLFRDSGAHRGNVAIRSCAVLLLGLFAVGAHAKTGDRNQPMNTSQDSVNGFNAPNTITTLTGHVVVTQGSMKATGDIAHIYLDANSQVSRIVMNGKPAHIQQLDDNDKLMTGEAPALDYDNINGIAVLTPNGVVTQQDTGDAHADKLTYNTQTTYFTGEGNVSMTYLPKPKPDKGAPAKPDAAQPAAASTAAAAPKP
ncbi:lipopolysaccharide transport periplasmic protein LptA [Dyella acidiphila]|uniref:Lipopolysaccharide transport periplasmic protein LptA n=1 Tax=Dyella acidiphila TaxID=2775866 RepID=A0ABR9G7V3_9GAMM|nr:lipopolysaccharide transport periplasmic protein LptA [Dyella acidiphila]MBE1160125.1 lipopolysaccharide transport periplasmic protein LptA [Dyella acidiphila]